MKPKLIIFVICQMLMLTVYSQPISTGYPKTVVIGSDTVIAITRQQRTDINVSLERLRMEKETNDSLLRLISSYVDVITIMEQEQFYCDSMLTMCELGISASEVVIRNNDKEMAALKRENRVMTRVTIVAVVVAIVSLVIQ